MHGIPGVFTGMYKPWVGGYRWCGFCADVGNMSGFHAQPSTLSDDINHLLLCTLFVPPSPFLLLGLPSSCPPFRFLLHSYPTLTQRAAGQRRGRTSVPHRDVMALVTWPVFTPTTAACQAVRTRTGSPQRVRFCCCSLLFQLLSIKK